MLLLYNLIAAIATPLAALAGAAKGRFGGAWDQRFGIDLTLGGGPEGRPRFWLHGASVGEIRSAAALLKALAARKPEAEFYLSSGTPAGLETAGKIAADYQGRVRIMAAPLDCWGAPGRTLDRVEPQALIIMETELWPALILAARKRGVKLILAAARMTPRSAQRYGLMKKTMARLLAAFDLIAAAGPEDRGRFAALGAPPEKLAVLGNPKFDALALEWRRRQNESQYGRPPDNEWRDKIWGQGGPAGRKLVVAGSTHPGEEEIVLRAFRRLPGDNLLILAPRHVTRSEEALRLAAAEGFTAAPLSGGEYPLAGRGQVIVTDRMGILVKLYEAADLAVVGGSFCKGGQGHNPLEPVAVGTPTLFGPRMGSFAREAEALIKAGAAASVQAEELAAAMRRWLDHPEQLQAARRAGQEFMAGLKPVGPELAEAVLKIINRQDDIPKR